MGNWTSFLKPRRIYDNLCLMLKIRLQRVGRKHEPTFRLVLTDSKNSSKSGRFDEVLGSYDPRKTSEAFNAGRIKDLIAKGIGLTGSVNNLLIKKGIIMGKKTHVGSNFVAKEIPQEASDIGSETPAEEANVEAKPEEAQPEEASPAETPAEEVAATPTEETPQA